MDETEECQNDKYTCIRRLGDVLYIRETILCIVRRRLSLQQKKIVFVIVFVRLGFGVITMKGR